MAKKVSFIVPCRDKAKFAAQTVKSVLDQTYSGMEIVLSDQGSVDGTFDIIKGLADSYTGPNKVRVLQCPHTEVRGMAGLNMHFNWIHEQIDSDIIIMCSADDLNHPDRAKYTVEAYEKHNPSYVGTCVQYCDADLKFRGEVTAYHYDGKFVDQDGFVDPVKSVNDLIGSSVSSSWSRDLWDKYGPLNGIESQDVLLPIFATMERGLWFISKQLHAYIRHEDINNTGLEGCLRAASRVKDQVVSEYEAEKDEEKRKEIEGKLLSAIGECNGWTELVNFHVTSNYFAILRRIADKKIPVDGALYDAIMNKAVHSANMWSMARDHVTMAGVQPKGMKIYG